MFKIQSALFHGTRFQDDEHFKKNKVSHFTEPDFKMTYISKTKSARSTEPDFKMTKRGVLATPLWREMSDGLQSAVWLR